VRIFDGIKGKVSTAPVVTTAQLVVLSGATAMLAALRPGVDHSRVELPDFIW
jgi:hypothetical protein